jgi:hypothetical protein
MFLAYETRLDVDFPDARARLANLAHGGVLTSVSRDSYGEGVPGLSRVGPLGSAPGISKLVAVEFGDLRNHDDSAWLPLRWQATGPDRRLFPALDANLTLTAAGPDTTMLKMEGSYRPPLGTLGARLDEMILRHVATATAKSFLHRVADAITHPAGAAEPGECPADPQPQTG